MTSSSTSTESAAPASQSAQTAQPAAAPTLRHYVGVALLLILMGLPLLNMPFGTDQSNAALTAARSELSRRTRELAWRADEMAQASGEASRGILNERRLRRARRCLLVGIGHLGVPEAA